MENIEKAIFEFNTTFTPTMEICKKYDISLGKFMRYLQLNKESSFNPRLRKAEELYSTGEYTLTKVAELVGLTRKRVGDHFKEARIEVTQPLRKYKYDDNFFEDIDTELKAYWLGFIYADGCIIENKFSKSLEIGLKYSDIDHLKKFQRDIGNYNGHVQVKTTKLKGKEYRSCRITVPNTKLCNDLISHGVLPRKSLILTFPHNLHRELVPHFLRGYFDGDGCINYRKQTDRYRIALVGTREFLEGFQSYFADIHGIENHRYGGKQIIQRKKGQKAYQYEKSGEGMFQILNILYGNANRYLERKYNLYLAVLNNCKDRYSEL